ARVDPLALPGQGPRAGTRCVALSRPAGAALGECRLPGQCPAGGLEAPSSQRRRGLDAALYGLVGAPLRRGPQDDVRAGTLRPGPAKPGPLPGHQGAAVASDDPPDARRTVVPGGLGALVCPLEAARGTGTLLRRSWAPLQDEPASVHARGALGRRLCGTLAFDDRSAAGTLSRPFLRAACVDRAGLPHDEVG